jgi:hypothetical protein
VRSWPLAAGIVALCAAALLLFLWMRRRGDSSNPALLSRLPVGDGVHALIDVQALRQAGLLELLAGSRAAEATDYRRFVESTGFDYREDLDAIVLSREPSGALYCLLRGRFEWERLQQYAQTAGGSCRSAFCSVPSDTPGRHVSYYSLLPDVLALAIDTDREAAYRLSGRNEDPPAEDELRHPVWVRFSAPALQPSEGLPAGTRVLVAAMQKAERVTLALDASGDGYEAILRARCRTAADADEITVHLQKMTDMLRKFFVRDKQTPNPRDLSGVLTEGTFRREDANVLGRWPIQRAFLETLAQGSL